mmetsp:Transcript_67702/g.141146  ORF Transcript_67702/g.141146 Transcript_67702/m.141146 type:complete len:818 (+) Transcript_67702:133-2586(+)
MHATVTIKAQERFSASTYYHMDVRSQVGMKTVKNKVYSDFEILHRNLESRIQNIPPLPPKKGTGDKKHRHEAIRSGLENFINGLLSRQDTAGDRAVCGFVCLPMSAAVHGLSHSATPNTVPQQNMAPEQITVPQQNMAPFQNMAQHQNGMGNTQAPNHLNPTPPHPGMQNLANTNMAAQPSLFQGPSGMLPSTPQTNPSVLQNAPHQQPHSGQMAAYDQSVPMQNVQDQKILESDPNNSNQAMHGTLPTQGVQRVHVQPLPEQASPVYGQPPADHSGFFTTGNLPPPVNQLEPGPSGQPTMPSPPSMNAPAQVVTPQQTSPPLGIASTTVSGPTSPMDAAAFMQQMAGAWDEQQDEQVRCDSPSFQALGDAEAARSSSNPASQPIPYDSPSNRAADGAETGVVPPLSGLQGVSEQGQQGVYNILETASSNHHSQAKAPSPPHSLGTSLSPPSPPHSGTKAPSPPHTGTNGHVQIPAWARAPSGGGSTRTPSGAANHSNMTQHSPAPQVAVAKLPQTSDSNQAPSVPSFILSPRTLESKPVGFEDYDMVAYPAKSFPDSLDLNNLLSTLPAICQSEPDFSKPILAQFQPVPGSFKPMGNLYKTSPSQNRNMPSLTPNDGPNMRHSHNGVGPLSFSPAPANQGHSQGGQPAQPSARSAPEPAGKLGQPTPLPKMSERTVSPGAYEAQYQGNDEKVLTMWLEELLEVRIDQPLQEALKSGVLLCNLVNKVRGGRAITRISKLNMPFPQRENIQAFCAAAREMGVSDKDNFTADDLYENKNFKQVVVCLLALSRNCYYVPDYNGPCIGKPEPLQEKRVWRR